jgi:hypothetical protein
MIGRRAGIGLSLLCALVFCAVAAPNASAGRTLFTCVKGGTKDFSDEHCTKEVTPGLGAFGHLAIEGGTSTNYVSTNTVTLKETSNAVFKTTLAGTKGEIVCAKSKEEGTATNELVKTVGQSVGSKISFKYSECTVTKPAGEGCKVKGGAFEFPNLKSTTFEKEEEVEFGVLYSPTEGTKLGELVIEGCKIKEMNKGYEVAGSLRAIPEGATTKFIELVTEKTLTISGQKASLLHQTTMRMAPPPKEPEKEENPLTYTKTIP